MNTYIVKLKQAAAMTGIALSSIAGSGAITPASALTFDFRPVAGTSQAAIDGFKAAGDRWSSVLTDPITVNIDINFTRLDPGILGQTGSQSQRYDYSRVYKTLLADRTSADDRSAVANLSTGPTFNMLLNRTANNPNGPGSATPYLDSNGNANNEKLYITNANAKALGLALDSPAQVMTTTARVDGFGSGIISDLTTMPVLATAGSDASITFSSDFAFDFDRSNGIDANKFDFVGVAAHEIGHALGFLSGVDFLDFFGNPKNGGPYGDDQFTFVNTLDLFRYSTASKNAGAIDWTADARDKYFSLDGGNTKIASFATGVTYGDGQQASHWKDNLGLGLMDPTFDFGELGVIRENDLRAFDVIGYNRASITATAVPEPADFIGTAIGAAFGVKLLQKRRKQLFKSTAKAV